MTHHPEPLHGRLFVWRGFRDLVYSLSPGGPYAEEELAKEFSRVWADLYRGARESCPFCRGPYNRESEESTSGFPNRFYKYTCRLCGFTFQSQTSQGIQDYFFSESVSILLELSVNDADVGFEELGTHIKHNFRDVAYLTPHRFAQLVGDIYRNLGYEVRDRPQTHDGGFDLVLLETSSGARILVQCKRYADNRTIGVGVVREMLGVHIYEGWGDAATRGVKIITTSRFSRDAAAMVSRINTQVDSTLFELVDAERLLRMLDIYSAGLPPLDIVLRSLGGSKT